MADNFNLINFKRGTLAALQSLNTAANRSQIEEGTFYLTLEEGNNAPESARLFIGRNIDGTKKIVPVNQGIITVADTTALNNLTGNFQTRDFAYVESGNILAVKSGTGWIQINASPDDNYLTELTNSVSDDSNGTATVALAATMSANGETPGDSFTITGDGGITVSGTGKAVTITGDEYELAAGAVSSNQLTVGLSSDAHPNNGAGSFDLKGAGGVTLTNTNGVIQIESADTKAETVVTSNETNGFGIAIDNDDGTSATKGVIDPIIQLGDHTGAGDGYHFANGIANLPVYTKAEVDAIKNTMNAMVYRGTIGTSTADFANTLAITQPAVGDTFRVMADMTGLTVKQSDGTLANNGTAHEGDLLILLGTETNGVITSGLYYDIIPAGDEFDTQYAVISKTKGIGIEEHNSSGDTEIGSLVLADGNKISVSESGTTAKQLTINHNTATVTTAAEASNPTIAQTEGSPLTFAVVTSITDDGYGHLSSVNTRTITVTDTNAEITSLADTVTAGTGNAANKEATVTTAVSVTPSDSVAYSKSDSFTIKSDNLEVTVPQDSDVKLNFVWGSFGS